MTTPIDPGDTAAMHDIFTDHCDYEGADLYPALEAVARAVVPPGHHVIADDDLRILLNFAVDAGERAGIAGYAPMLTDAYDRLRAAIGEAA